MSLKNTACIAGAWEHPTRRADDKSVAQLHAEVARGALADAGLSLRDVDAPAASRDHHRAAMPAPAAVRR